jgi:hypothetical protein
MDKKANLHARQFLVTLDPDHQLYESYKSYLESAPPKAGRKDLHSWCLARIKGLCGAESFVDALRRPEFLTLLALGYVGYQGGGYFADLKLARSMPLPAVLSKLEDAFFPELVKEVAVRSASSPLFSAHLEKSRQWVWRAITGLQANLSIPHIPTTIAATSSPDGGDILNGILGFLVIAAIVTWTLRGKD